MSDTTRLVARTVTEDSSRRPEVERASLERLDQAVDDFIAFARRVPEQHVEPSATAEWGAREVLIHLVAWHETYAHGLERRLADLPIELPAGTFRQRNARMVADNAGVSLDDLLSRWRAAQIAVHAHAADPRAAGLSLRFKASGKEWPLPEFIDRVEAHIRNHQRQLARAVRRAGSSA